MATISTNVIRPSFKQSEIVDDIRGKIAAGILAPGTRLPPLRELAIQYEASYKTAVRAIQHLAESNHVVTKLRAGTFVSENPPTLCNIAVIFPYMSDTQYWSQYSAAWKLEAERLVAIHAMANREIRFSFFYTRYDFSATEEYSKLLDGVRNHNFAGLIFLWQPDEMHMAELFAPDLHRVVLVQGIPLRSDEDPRNNITRLICRDSFIQKGLDFFASKGCRRVAFLTLSFPRQFYDTLVKETEARGMTTDFHLVQGLYAHEPHWAANCVAMMARAFRQEKVDALFITDDNLLSYATQGLKRATKSLPENLLVLSQANFPHVPPAAVPVRLFGYDIRGLLKTTIDVIFKKQRKQAVPVQTSFQIYMDDELPYTLPAIRVFQSNCKKS